MMSKRGLTSVATFLVLAMLAACGGGGSAAAPPNNVPRFAYVANYNDNTVSAYTVNPTTGQLRHNGYIAAGINPASVTVDPSGKFAYVANSFDGAGGNSVSTYTINAATGTLTSVGAPVATGTSPFSVIVDPSGKFLYVTNSFNGGGGNSVSAYAINATTGVLTAVGGSPFAAGGQPASITVDPSGKFAYVANNLNGAGGNSISAYSINATTGALTSIGAPVATGTNPISVTVDPSSRFAYVANNLNGAGGNSISAYSINATTGALTSIGAPVATGPRPISVTVDPSGRFAYVANYFSGAGGNSIWAYSINATTGALTSIGAPVATGTGPYSITVDPSGKFAYVANVISNNISAYSIDSTTGALTVVSTVAGRTGVAMAMTRGTAAVTYTPKFAYVANASILGGGNSVSAYTINATTGALASIGMPVAAGTAPSDVTVDPFGRFAYVTNSESGDVSAYAINATTGALASVGTVSAGQFSSSVRVDPSGRFAYVTNAYSFGVGSNNVLAYLINPATGALTSIGAPMTAGTSPSSVAVDPSGQFAYVANSFDGVGGNSISAYRISTMTGALTSIGAAVPAGTRPSAVTVDPSGQFVYVTNLGSNDVWAYSINGVTGELTFVGSVASGNAPISVTVDPTGKFVYVANFATNDVSAYTIYAGTGALTSIGVPVTAEGGPASVTVDPSGKFAYVVTTNGSSSGVLTYSINATTGALTSLGAPVEAGSIPRSVITTGTIQ